jgi:hypothetical protein
MNQESIFTKNEENQQIQDFNNLPQNLPFSIQSISQLLEQKFSSLTPITTAVEPMSNMEREIPISQNIQVGTSTNRMEFGELKIVHEIKVSSGNVDPSVVGQAFTQLTRDPSFVKTLETKIKDLQGGMGQQVQMNPLTA